MPASSSPISAANQRAGPDEATNPEVQRLVRFLFPGVSESAWEEAQTLQANIARGDGILRREDANANVAH